MMNNGHNSHPLSISSKTMMKLAVLLSVIAGASAFVPASQSTTSRVQLNAADLETLRGVGPETGGKVVSSKNMDRAVAD